MTDASSAPNFDHAQAAEELLRRAIAHAAAQKYPAPVLVALADHIARTALHLRALQQPAPARDLPLVQLGLDQGGPSRDQATFHLNTGAAKASLSRLITYALAGDNVVICRDGRPAVRLVPYDQVVTQTPPPSKLDPLCAEDDRDWFKPYAADWNEEDERRPR